MIETICYLAIFIVETVTSVLYFEIKFKRKSSFNIVLLLSVWSFLISFFVNTLGLFILNVVIFFLVNFVILFFCYESKIQACIFNISLLIVYMIVTELIVLYFSELFFNHKILPEDNEPIVLIIQTTASKLLYFSAVYITAKLSKKEQKNEKNPFLVFLSVLPISSIIIMITTAYICIYYDIDKNSQIILVISNILMLVANIIVFYIYEYTLNTNRKYTMMLLEKQSAESNEEYYKLLAEQNETSNVMIHDIKRHLNAIRNMLQNNLPPKEINGYIDEIVGVFEKSERVDYCGNTLLNLITYRYARLSKLKGIEFQVNIREANLKFLSDYDITALFDNLLENAIEAAETTKEKYIEFSIYSRNENFVIIKILNSFSVKPQISNGKLSSSKAGKFHGIGTVSIKRIISKYNGSLDIDVNDENKTFCVTIVFKTKKE